MKLHLILTKQWFDKIRSGVKTEEYREIKPYWIGRLIKSNWQYLFDLSAHEYIPLDKVCGKEYTSIIFTNGYGKHRPSFEIECKGISIGKGKLEWGARTICDPFSTEIENTFILSLGNILTQTFTSKSDQDDKDN